MFSPPPSFISACHTQRIKIKREVGEVAIVAVLAGRWIGDGGISNDSHNKPGYLRYSCYMDSRIQKNLPFVHCFKNSIHRRGAVLYMYQEK
jgi:hypothetical protein